MSNLGFTMNYVDNSAWNSGQPPYTGWWNASASKDESCWRWFSGGNFHFHAYSDYSAKLAGIASTVVASGGGELYWRWYYPENARVPRIDPRTGKPCLITHPRRMLPNGNSHSR